MRSTYLVFASRLEALGVANGNSRILRGSRDAATNYAKCRSRHQQFGGCPITWTILSDSWTFETYDAVEKGARQARTTHGRPSEVCVAQVGAGEVGAQISGIVLTAYSPRRGQPSPSGL